jgi:hypothetical protein
LIRQHEIVYLPFAYQGFKVPEGLAIAMGDLANL